MGPHHQGTGHRRELNDMTNAVLITQCLQQDFVAPVGRYDRLPNLLHIGFGEARQLMGAPRGIDVVH